MRTISLVVKYTIVDNVTLVSLLLLTIGILKSCLVSNSEFFNILTVSDVSTVFVTLWVVDTKYKPFSGTENFWFKTSLALLLKISEILPLSLLLSVVKFPYFVNKFSTMENFSKYEFKNNWEQITYCDSMSAQIITAGKILVQILTYNFNRKIGKTRLTFPKTFGATPFVAITDNDNAVAGTNLDYAIGWNTASYVDISNVVGGFTVLLIGII